MKDLWLLGGGGAALEVLAVIEALREAGALAHRLRGLGVLEAPRFELGGLEVLSETELLERLDPKRDEALVALGSPAARARAAARLSERGVRSPVLVHPRAELGPRVRLGPGTVVMALCVLETDVEVGPHGLLNVHSSVAHEGRLGAFVSLGPGAHLAGRATVGERCDLGAGCVLRPGITLGPDTVVGAGAAVVEDHGGGGVLVGVPARPLSR